MKRRDELFPKHNDPETHSRSIPEACRSSNPQGWPTSLQVVSSTPTPFGEIGHAIILEGRLPDCYEHNSSMTILSLGLRGQARVEWKRGGRLSRFVVAPGSFTIVPSGEDNSFCMDRPLQTLNLVYGPDQLRAVADREWEHHGPAIEIAPAYRQTVPEVVTLGQALADLVRSPRKGSGLYIETLWTQVAIQLLWNYSSLPRQAEDWVERLSDPRLRRVIDYIDVSLGSEISLGDLADVAGLSPNYFLNAFKKATGKTPHRLLTEKRVAKACDLLRNPQIPIAHVALDVGYSSQSHLTTVFRRLRKTTPALFRAQVLGLGTGENVLA